MTSLVVPIACWNSYPKSTLITATANYSYPDGDSVMAIAYASGHIWTYEASENTVIYNSQTLWQSDWTKSHFAWSCIGSFSYADWSSWSWITGRQVIHLGVCFRRWVSLRCIHGLIPREMNLWDLSDGHCIANSKLVLEGGLNSILVIPSALCLISVYLLQHAIVVFRKE